MKRIIATLAVLAVGATLLTAPSVAFSKPGNTCNPAPGHGNAGCHKVAAPPVASVATSPTVTVLAGPSKVKVRKKLNLSGSVSPTDTLGTVSIVKTRLVGKKWKKAGTATVAVTGGSYAYSFRPTKKGKWRFVAKFSGGVSGSTTYASSKSRVKTVKVK